MRSLAARAQALRAKAAAVERIALLHIVAVAFVGGLARTAHALDTSWLTSQTSCQEFTLKIASTVGSVEAIGGLSDSDKAKFNDAARQACRGRLKSCGFNICRDLSGQKAPPEDMSLISGLDSLKKSLATQRAKGKATPARSDDVVVDPVSGETIVLDPAFVEEARKAGNAKAPAAEKRPAKKLPFYDPRLPRLFDDVADEGKTEVKAVGDTVAIAGSKKGGAPEGTADAKGDEPGANRAALGDRGGSDPPKVPLDEAEAELLALSGATTPDELKGGRVRAEVAPTAAPPPERTAQSPDAVSQKGEPAAVGRSAPVAEAHSTALPSASPSDRPLVEPSDPAALFPAPADAPVPPQRGLYDRSGTFPRAPLDEAVERAADDVSGERPEGSGGAAQSEPPTPAPSASPSSEASAVPTEQPGATPSITASGTATPSAALSPMPSRSATAAPAATAPRRASATPEPTTSAAAPSVGALLQTTEPFAAGAAGDRIAWMRGDLTCEMLVDQIKARYAPLGTFRDLPEEKKEELRLVLAETCGRFAHCGFSSCKRISDDRMKASGDGAGKKSGKDSPAASPSPARSATPRPGTAPIASASPLPSAIPSPRASAVPTATARPGPTASATVSPKPSPSAAPRRPTPEISPEALLKDARLRLNALVEIDRVERRKQIAAAEADEAKRKAEWQRISIREEMDALKAMRADGKPEGTRTGRTRPSGGAAVSSAAAAAEEAAAEKRRRDEARRTSGRRRTNSGASSSPPTTRPPSGQPWSADPPRPMQGTGGSKGGRRAPPPGMSY